MNKGLVLAIACCAFAALIALAGCGSSGTSSSSSGSASSSSASSASSVSASSASSASASSASSASASSATASTSSSTQSASTSSSATSSSSSASASSAASAPETKDGKQIATGTVVTTTIKDRAAELGKTGGDWESPNLLTLLVLDKPIRVTAYYGGSDTQVEASVICLPNDEMFRQFSGKEITIGVNDWGAKPADIMGMLYDLTVDFDNDGLVLIEPSA